jgi:anti-repressor protein
MDIVKRIANEKWGIVTITKGDELWFVASDVCDSLDLSNVSQSVSRLDDDEKDIISNDTLGGSQFRLGCFSFRW